MRTFIRLVVRLVIVVGFVYASTFGGCLALKARTHAPAEALLDRRLQSHVRMLAETIGNRNLSDHAHLMRAADYIEAQFLSMGYTVQKQPYVISGRESANLIAERPGTRKPEELIIVGAHYDTLYNPGADDNASGVAGVLELARAFAGKPTDRTIRFVAFTNEEPPYFKSNFMGSRQYVRSLKDSGSHVVGAVILEMIGYYDERPFSQRYPPLFGPLYPNRGDFIGIVGNFKSAPLVKRAKEAFKAATPFPVESVVTLESVPGVDWSDNWSFWQEGYPAIMATDTAFFRNPHYHTADDTWDTLDYMRMAGAVEGLTAVVDDLSRSSQ